MPIPTKETRQDFSQWHVTAGTANVVLAPGVVAPTSVSANGPFVLMDASLVRVRINATYSQATRAFELREVLLSAPEGATLKETALRQIPPLLLVRRTIPRTFKIDADNLGPAVQAFITPGYLGLGRTMLADAALEDAVAIYRIAEAVSARPVKEIADAFGVPMHTVRAWMQSARERGSRKGVGSEAAG